ncbi:MAG: C1 family peptidase [Actinomycetota bacterium]
MAKPTISQVARKIASAGLDWEAGETPLTALPEADQDIRLGVQVPPGEQERVAAALAAAPEGFAAFDSARDWRDVDGKNWITAVRDQGNCGSCVAHGTVAAMEAQARIEHKDPTWDLNLSEADLFFCGAGKRCSQGWWPTEALKYASSKGIADEACFPYVDHDVDCTVCSDKASRMLKVGASKELISPGDRKGWIDTNGPVIACMAVYADFFNYKNGVYRHATGPLRGYHCITCVGYNEDEGYWICKNSWGTSWGDNGFFKIAYGEAEIDSKFAMWGVENISGTLRPAEEEDGEQGTDMADYVVVRDGSKDGSAILLAHVKGGWRHLALSSQRLASLGPIAFSSTAVEVTYKGEDILTLNAWKKY